MNFNAVWFPSVNIVGMHKIVTVIFFFFVAEDHSRCHNSNIKKIN